jgi:methionyl-tRNA formyltransferase
VPATANAPNQTEPGTLLAEQRHLFVACGHGTRLEVRELQLEGRKRLPALEFLNGVRIVPGEKLL